MYAGVIDKGEGENESICLGLPTGHRYAVRSDGAQVGSCSCISVCILRSIG